MVASAHAGLSADEPGHRCLQARRSPAAQTSAQNLGLLTSRRVDPQERLFTRFLADGPRQFQLPSYLVQLPQRCGQSSGARRSPH